jgi:hypothetical protein
MSERNDLTHWNRAGLTRFIYVDGKAAEYLEILRQQLVMQFADPETGLCEWLKPAKKMPANEEKVETETLIQRQERLSRKQERILEMYHQDRRDWAWEITRTFARACHILTEHTNAYANEGYLGTATQWDNVRRLVEMLDYHPAPPASASTRLVLTAKENKSGIVAKGFQLKHSPAAGGDKIIFETLEDLLIDPALNELRPKGWNQSEDPALPQNGTQPPTGKPQFSKIAKGPVINIRGVGQKSAFTLDRSASASKNGFKIKDFLNLDPDNFELDIAATLLWEWKAKADILINFAPEGNWSVILEWLLPEIAEASAASLAELSVNSKEMAKALKLDIEIIEICLDQPVYSQTRFKDLFAPVAVVAGTVKTLWHAKRKPKVVPGDVAMMLDESNNVAEAVTIESVVEVNAEETSADENLIDIHLFPSPVQYSWRTWPKSKTTFHYSPRWKRKCWLNGRNVIRTKKPHGLTVGTFIGWKKEGIWQYAEIIEADKRNLRLEYDGQLPEQDTELFQLSPIDGSKVSPQYEVIVLLGEESEGGDVRNAVDDVPPEISESPFDSIFTIDDTVASNIGSGGGGFLPPGALPKIGSFLFPSPMLPMDLVKAAVELMLNLGVMQIPSTGEIVIKGLPFEGDLAGEPDMEALGGILYDMLDGMESVDSDGVSTNKKLIKWNTSFDDKTNPEQTIQNRKDALTELLSKAEGKPSALFQEIKSGIERSGPLLAIPKEASKIADVDSLAPRYVIEGESNKIAIGDWVVGEFSDGLRALKVRAVNEFTDSEKAERFSLSFENLLGNVGELKNVYADFRGELVAEGAAVNNTPVDPEEIELEDVPESLKVGRDVLLECDCNEIVVAKIDSIDGNFIKTNPPAHDCCTKGGLIIHGNVVDAGHGEVKPEKILGSGDAAKSNQEFTLEVEKVSFTPDATKSSGVAAAIEVEVAGRVWEQVSTLKDSGPGDHHYAIRMTEEGYVKILFGDGEYGRRLPSGKNNIRVRYRVGSGLAGNVPVGGLEKPVSPHPLIKAVRQPLPAAGGGDMEDMASLRENAPSTLLAFERAVSLSDFSHLAAAQSSVWQAKAYSQILHGGRTESVKVVIVPADGVTSEDIENDIENFLQKHALPGVQVTIDPFVEKRFSLSVTVRVKIDEFVAEEVEKAVASALSDHFTLKNRKLGEHLYLSEVYKVVESVQGVENSICVLNNDDNLQLIRAENEKTVVYLDTDAGSTLTVTAKEYLP